jgi:gliding motility-associated-like protein
VSVFFRVIVLLTVLHRTDFIAAQQPYNSCNEAMELCSGQVYTVDNYSANITFCPDCEDDFTVCFTPSSSIWFTFTTNASGGDVNVDFSNLIFSGLAGAGTAIQATVVSAVVPCNSASYSTVSNCVSNGNAPFSLSATGLTPNTLYYVVVNGDNTGTGVTQPAECTFDISVSGPGIDRTASTVVLSTGTQPFCANQPITVTAELTDCPDTSAFNWYVNGELSAVTTEPYFQSSGLNNGDIVSLETSCYLLCPVTITDTLDPVSIITLNVDAGPDITIEQGDTVQLFGSTSASVFNWAPGFGVSAPDALSPYVWPSSTTVYTLSATDGPCSQSDQVTVNVTSQLFFPNTFSPNDDGSNDTWVILGIDLYPNSFVRIYDRWGQEVFQSTGYSAQKAWDGTVPSGEATEGVYFYIVELRDADKQLFQGSITVIR